MAISAGQMTQHALTGQEFRYSADGLREAVFGAESTFNSRLTVLFA